jgi:hypothetical protein
VIATIADFLAATPAEIREAQASINLRGVLKSQLALQGKEERMTSEEWEHYMETRTPETCRCCNGKGTVLPPSRMVGVVHASYSESCVRSLYYDVTADKRTQSFISPELQFTFAIGHAIHDLVQKSLHRALGENFQSEVKVDLPKAYILGSSTDGVVTLPLCRVVLEIKTMSEDEWGKLRKPLDKHITQAAGMYAVGLDVPFTSFLYISKGWPHDVKEFVLPYDDRVFKRWWVRKGSKLEKALEAGAPPQADATAYECKSCGHEWRCEQSLANKKDRFHS